MKNSSTILGAFVFLQGNFSVAHGRGTSLVPHPMKFLILSTRRKSKHQTVKNPNITFSIVY